MLNSNKKLTAFSFAITGTNKKTCVTYASKYYFDPIAQTIYLKNDNDKEIGKIDLIQEDILKVDIYNQATPASNYVQTILSGRNAP